MILLSIKTKPWMVQLSNIETEQKIAKDIDGLARSIRFMHDDLDFLKIRLKRHSRTSSSTNARVFWWTLFQIGIVALVCMFQIYYLRSFFERKRF